MYIEFLWLKCNDIGEPQFGHASLISMQAVAVKDKSRLVGKPTICIGENKGADQLRSNCEADQRLCFRYSDSTIPLLLKSEMSSF